MKVRDRIFGKSCVNELLVNKRFVKLRKFRDRCRMMKKIGSLHISSFCSLPQDPRPYARISIAGVEMVGLLDSGASVSGLGKGAEEFVTRAGLQPIRLHSKVHTADGAGHAVTGYVIVPVTYQGVTKKMKLCLMPSLSQSLYLGIDFWSKFNIVPHLVNEINLSSDQINKPVNLSENQMLRLQAVKDKFPSFAKMGLGKTDLEEHVIDTGDAVPIKQRHYPVSPAIQTLMYAELDRMLEMGVIEESNSPWNSPVVLVRKPGKNRLCLDSRKVNQVTIKDAYPLPHIGGLLSRLQDTRFISSIDLKDAFWQIPLEKKSREKTAFTVPGRPLYQYTVMPFGLCNAPQRMCRLMDKVIPGRLRENVFCYLDDLLVVSPDFETHLRTLEEVALCLRKSGLTINLEKSRFCVGEVKYLGFVIGDGTLRTDPDKVSAIKEFPLPKSTKQVRRFLGMTGWYQRFVLNYASLAAPLTDCLKIGKVFSLTPEAIESFEALKKALCEAPVLATPDFSKRFYVQCDASTTGVGGVLFQKDDEGNDRPIAFMSKKLTPTQRNYSITELECYAAILSIKKFRPYVEGHAFTVITDHSSLRWLMDQKDLAGRLARWSLKLQGFDFEIEHRKGSQNVVPDALSRVYAESLTPDTAMPKEVDLNSPYFASAEYEELKKTISENASSLPDVCVIDGFVYRRCAPRSGDPDGDDLTWKLWIPTELTEQLIRLAHEPPQTAHGGVHKTLYRLRQKYFWPGMVTQVRDLIARCEVCKETKDATRVSRPPMGEQFQIDRPFQFLYVDFLGPYPRTKSGNSAIFVVLDGFSKFVFLHPVRAETADAATKFLENEVFCKFGVPEVLFSDNGKQFVSKQFEHLLTTYGVRHVRTAKHSPHPNASERVNRSVLAAIRAYVDEDQRTWDVHLEKIACALRTTVHQAHGTDPFHVLFGMHMAMHGSIYPLWRKLKDSLGECLDVRTAEDNLEKIRQRVKKNLALAHKRHANVYNTRSRDVQYRPGQEVFCRTFPLSNMQQAFNAKLANKFTKARIVRQVGNSLYDLEDLKGKSLGTYHAKDLRQ